jgi:hypothetical protein
MDGATEIRGGKKETDACIEVDLKGGVNRAWLL